VIAQASEGAHLDASFPKSARILKRVEFKKIGRRGRRVQTKNFIVLVCRTRQSTARIGITASRRVGNAYVRNRYKRLIREYFRTHRREFDDGIDIVVIVKNAAKIEGLRDVESNFEQFFHKAPYAKRTGSGIQDRPGSDRPL
jgi:ribonuclease P protein component